MVNTPSRDKKTHAPEHFEARFSRDVGRKAERKLRARRAAGQGIWFWFGMFGLVGWSVAVPTLMGIALGVWFDRLFPGRISWTLTLLMVGVALGCFNAWQWIKQEDRT